MKGFLIAISLVLTGCALSPSKESLRVQEVTDEYIQSRGDCVFLTTKTRNSGWGGMMANIGLENAQIAVKGDAGEIGGDSYSLDRSKHWVLTVCDSENIQMWKDTCCSNF